MPTAPSPSQQDVSEEAAAREVEQFEAWLQAGHLDHAKAEVVLKAIRRWRPAVVARVGEIMAENPPGQAEPAPPPDPDDRSDGGER